MAASITLHGLAALWLLIGQHTPGESVQSGDVDAFIVTLSKAKAVEPAMQFKPEVMSASKSPVRSARQDKARPSPATPERKVAQPEAINHAIHEFPAMKGEQATTSVDEDTLGSSSSAIMGEEGNMHRIRHHLERYKFYPVSARRRGVGGSVEVGFQLDRKGHAHGIFVLAGSGYSLLDWAAKETVKRAEPFPATGGDYRFTLLFNKL